MILHRGSRKAKSLLRRTSNQYIEQLEERTLLTTVHGGDTLEFVDQRGQFIRAHVDGPASAQFDLIGATNINGAYGLNDIPMTIIHADGTVTNILGGTGGAGAADPIEVVIGGNDSNTDLVNPNQNNGPSPAFGLPAQVAPSGGININTISSNSTGKTWGFNQIQQTVGGAQLRRIELVNINYTNTTDPARGITPADAVIFGDIAPQIAQVTGAADTTAINSIVGCDFLPSNDNLLYFVVSVNVSRFNALGNNNQATTGPIFFLLRFNFAKPFDSAVEPVNLGLPGNQTEFISDQANAGFLDVAPTVQGMSFTSNDRLVAMVTGRAVGGVGDNTAIASKTGLVELNPNNPVFDLNQITPVVANGTAITDLHGLEVVPGDDDFVYGINGTAGNQIIYHVNRLSRPNALAVNFGPLDVRNDGVAIGLIGDLDWNPALPSSFVAGKKGSLIAEDQTRDQLLVIDTRNRFPLTDLYSIYATNTTAATSFSVAVVPNPTTPVRPMLPFTGNVSGILHVNAQTGVINPAAPLSTPTATGAFVLGGKETGNSLLAPRRLRKLPSQRFGALPNSTRYVSAGYTIVGDIYNMLIGGLITGNVRVFGSANILYAGDWLTGDPQGRLQSDPATDLESNIYVGGDVRDILSDSDFGALAYTAGVLPIMVSGYSVAVGGKLGMMKAIGSYVGTGTYVSNTVEGTGLGIAEVEDRRGTPSGAVTYFEGFAGGPPSLGDTTDFYNDTFENPQYVSSGLARAFGTDQVAVINGNVHNAAPIGDNIDYYAMGLLAGQTVTVQLTATFSTNGLLNLGTAITVFDPDGRLIDSDRTVVGVPQALRGKAFQFTADRPGAYRFAVSGSANYTLTLTGVANVALGGVIAGDNILDYDFFIVPFHVHTGDAGAFFAGNEILDANSTLEDPLTQPYTIDRGNLRSMEAGSIGDLTSGLFGSWINLTVPRGSVGLMRATSGTGILVFNLGLVPLGPGGVPNGDVAIGGDYQLVDAANEFTAYMLADRSIGSVRIGETTTTVQPYLVANADQRGSDGVIDLIDCRGNFGILGTGGPHIFTGPGGNVRYLRIGGQAFESSKFGGGPVSATVLNAGEKMPLIDDSGTPFTLVPTPQIKNTAKVLPTDPDLLNPGQLSVMTYGVDDNSTATGGKAGVIVFNVTVLSPGGGNHGLLVEADPSGRNGSVEIGQINVSGGRDFVVNVPAAGGPPIINDPRPAKGTVPGAPDTTTPLDIVFTGNATIDAWDIEAAGNVDSIDNETPNGEVVNVTATGVGDLAADWIGIAKSHTGVDSNHAGNAVNGINILDDGGEGAAPGTLTPFIQQRNLIHISGGLTPFLISARARRGIGNIYVQGIIGNIVADSNGKQGKGPGFDGIDGPIVAGDSVDASLSTVDGRIKFVDIGQGINFGGRGQVPFAGLFATQTIEQVIGRGPGRDIRGPVLVNAILPSGAVRVSNPVDGANITSINLNGGSIISSPVIIGGNFNDWQPVRGTVTIPSIADNPTTPHFDIGSIRITNGGGIIGSSIVGPDIGPIKIEGFGFINSELGSDGGHVIAGIDTTGYGIRGSLIDETYDLRSLVARGTGKLVDAKSFSGSVAYSTKKAVDPFFHIAPNENTDIYHALGLGKKSSKKKSISNTGVIENLTANGAHALGTISAYQLRGRNGGKTSLDFPNSITAINLLDGSDEVELSTGTLNHFTTGADIAATDISAADGIVRVDVGGTLRGSSTVRSLGPDGNVSTIKVHRGMFATVHSTVGIGSIIVGGNLGSANISTINNIDLLSVNGSIVSGANIDNIEEEQILPFKKLGELFVGKNIEAGATIRVEKLIKQHVGGVINGDLIVGPRKK